MTDLYTAVCMQMNRTGIDHRKEIRKANLDRCLELFGYAALRISYREYAPLKLVVFPEVFMQGWNDNPAPYSNIFTKVAKDMAIRIPGEETELLSEQAKKLLLEIELCDVSVPKGLSILRVAETEGDYLPHLYNAKPPSQVRCIDLNEVIQATDDLVVAGWLKPHAAEGKVTEYRRTSRSVRL